MKCAILIPLFIVDTNNRILYRCALAGRCAPGPSHVESVVTRSISGHATEQH
jgi:hypothetical protein